jgi:hypothetical protein
MIYSYEYIINVLENNMIVERQTQYEVTFGPKKEHDRDRKIFHMENDAMSFFREKGKDMHVDVYMVTTTVISIKMT